MSVYDSSVEVRYIDNSISFLSVVGFPACVASSEALKLASAIDVNATCAAAATDESTDEGTLSSCCQTVFFCIRGGI